MIFTPIFAKIMKNPHRGKVGIGGVFNLAKCIFVESIFYEGHLAMCVACQSQSQFIQVLGRDIFIIKSDTPHFGRPGDENSRIYVE